MQTQAHILINHVLLRRKILPFSGVWCFWGAFLPDLPMFIFYPYYKLYRSAGEAQIWQTLYNSTHWQLFFDLFNSLPISLALFFVSLWNKSAKLRSFSLSLILHILFDFFLHHDDAHRHFLPFSHFRFHSPLSYWDPRHYGTSIGLLEAFIFFALTLYMWPQMKRVRDRAFCLMGNLVYWFIYAYWGVLLSS